MTAPSLAQTQNDAAPQNLAPPTKGKAEAPLAEKAGSTTETALSPGAVEESKADALAETSSKAHLKREVKARDDWREKNPSNALPPRADILALTVSGGVSLGAYEAGMLHILTEALRKSPGSAKLKVVTGASAGSANALIAATDACLRKVQEPEQTLGYKVWVETGLDNLFDPQKVTARSLFMRKGLNAGFDEIGKRWKKGLPKECDFVFGITVTREHGYDVHLGPGLVVPRQAERFVVRTVGQGSGRAPFFENYLDPAQNFERPLLPLTSGRDVTGKTDIAAIAQLVSASAAFPVAFEPQLIEHCVTERRTNPGGSSSKEPPQCDVATRIDPFVDGAVFDNNPLGIAYQIGNDALIKTPSGSAFRPIPTGGDEVSPEIVYGYIDPDLRNYARYEPPKKREEETSDPMLSILTRLGGQVLNSARGQELANLAERNPRALNRLWLLEGSYPPISELIAAFFGFFERDFRDFDFHLGSYDSLRDLRSHSGSMLGVEPFLRAFNSTISGPLSKIPRRYKKLGCILAHVEPDRHNRLAPLCAGDDQKNFRILLQVTIDRLWSNCRRITDSEAAARSHLQCKRARGGLPAPVVDSSFRVKGERFQRSNEDEFEYSMRLMGDYGFHFKDLHLRPSQSKHGKRALRRKLALMVQALGDAQPSFTDRTVVLTAGRLMVNSIAYEPPPQRWYVTLGSSIAVGYLHRIADTQPFYWNVDGRYYNLRSLLTGRAHEFAGAFGAGVEWAVMPLSGSIAQTSIGVRGAYQMSAEDTAGFKGCQELEVASDSRRCSQPVIHLPLNLTLLERVRFNLTPVILPMGQKWGHNAFDLEIGIGGEFF